VAALALLKLWLVSGQSLQAIAVTSDDGLFLRSAAFLSQRLWLGPYDHLTLVKGPGYPLWIALSYWCGVPLLLGEQLLYITACATLAVALRPVFPSRALLLGIYSLVLWNPMTFTAAVLRVIREGIYPAETLFVIACLIGVLTRRDCSWRHLGAWAAGLGLAVTACWVTREDAVWLVPPLTVILGYTFVSSALSQQDRRLVRLAVCLLPLALWGLGVAGLCVLNWVNYGIFATCETRWDKFLAAYGALSRVEHSHWERYIPVPQETRRRIYPVSPAFRDWSLSWRASWAGAGRKTESGISPRERAIRK
jgi:hypothetical protein